MLVERNAVVKVLVVQREMVAEMKSQVASPRQVFQAFCAIHSLFILVGVLNQYELPVAKDDPNDQALKIVLFCTEPLVITLASVKIDREQVFGVCCFVS